MEPMGVSICTVSPFEPRVFWTWMLSATYTPAINTPTTARAARIRNAARTPASTPPRSECLRSMDVPFHTVYESGPGNVPASRSGKLHGQCVDVLGAGFAQKQGRIIGGQTHPAAELGTRGAKVLQVHQLLHPVIADANALNLDRGTTQEVDILARVRPLREPNRRLRHLHPTPGFEIE